MHVDRPLVRRSARAEQRVDETGQAVRLADYDIGVFAQLVLVELPLEQLRGTSDAAERIFDLMGQLPDHLPPGAVLDEQGVLAADAGAARDVGYLDQQHGVANGDRGDAAVDDTFVRVNLGRREMHFVGVVVTGRRHAAEHLAHLRFVVDKAQQRLAPGTPATDTEDVFCGGVEIDDQEVLVEQDHARTQAVENLEGIVRQHTAAGAVVTQRLTVLCCT